MSCDEYLHALPSSKDSASRRVSAKHHVDMQRITASACTDRHVIVTKQRAISQPERGLKLTDRQPKALGRRQAGPHFAATISPCSALLAPCASRATGPANRGLVGEALAQKPSDHDLYRDEAKGAFIIDLERREDDRGFFARAFCQTRIRGARTEAGHRPGQHRVQPPQGHAARHALPVSPGGRNKAGAMPVGVRSWTSSWTCGPSRPPTCSTSRVELSADNHRALYIPERFAHGYQALEDNTETSYQVGEFYTPGSEGGLLLRRSAPRTDVAAAGRGHVREGSAVAAARRRSRRTARPNGAHASLRAERSMIIVDTALQARESRRPAHSRRHDRRRVHGHGLTNQIVNSVPGMRVVAIYNRHVERARRRLHVRSERAPTPWSPTRRRARRRDPRRKQPVGHRGRVAAGALRAHRCAGRSDRFGRVRRAASSSRRSSTARTSCC